MLNLVFSLPPLAEDSHQLRSLGSVLEVAHLSVCLAYAEKTTLRVQELL